MGHYNIIIRVPSVPGFAECDVLVPMGGPTIWMIYWDFYSFSWASQARPRVHVA